MNKKDNPARLLIDSILLADEINKLLRNCINNNDLQSVLISLEAARNKNEVLKWKIRKTNRAMRITSAEEKK